MSIESQLYGRYSAAADKAQTLDQLKAVQNDIYKATQSGVLHPVEGVPLVQSLTPRIQQAEQAQQQALLMQYAPQGQPQPQGMPQGQPQGQAPAPAPIAPQIMNQAQQISGVDNLRSNLPAEEGYATGGIIAFAGGGDTEDDSSTDDGEDYGGLSRQEQAIFDQFLADIGGNEEDYQQETDYGINPEDQGSVNQGITYKEPLPSGGSKGITSNIDRDQARKYNVGNLRPSGFTYPGQVGVSGGGFAMFENPEAGIAALNQDIGIKLRRGLDTPLKFISVYAPAADKNDVGAYASNVARALGIGPNDRIPDTPQAKSILASAITRQEGADKATARFANGGPISFASGGESEVPESTLGNLIFGDPKKNKEFTEKYLEESRRKAEVEKALAAPELDLPFYKAVKPSERADIETRRNELYKQLPGVQPSSPVPATPGLTPEEMRIGSGTPASSGLPAIAATLAGRQDPATYGLNSNFVPTATTPAQEPAAPVEVPDDIREIRELLKERTVEAKKQKETDAYMALLQAGLGMMGGTSPYAMVNIGQGGSSGIAAYAASRKAQVADENAILAGRLGLSKAELLEKSRQNAIAQRIAATAINEKRYADELKLKTNIAATNKNLAEQRITQTEKANKIKETTMRNKAIKDWNDSQDKIILEKDLAAQKSNWRKDTKLNSEYERRRQNFIREQTLEYGANALDANDIAPLPQQ